MFSPFIFRKMAKHVDGTSSPLHQPKKEGLKRKREIKAGNKDQKLEKLETRLKRRKGTHEGLVKTKEELKSWRTALELEIETLKFDITVLERRRDESKVAALELKIERNKCEDATLKLKIETLKSNITGLEKERDKSNVTAMEMEIERIKSKDTALKLKIETENCVVNGLEKVIKTHKSRVTALEQQIDGLISEITALEQEIDRVKSNITAMERKIERQKSFMPENKSMDIDSAPYTGSPVDPMRIDSEELTDAFPLPPPERPAKETCPPTSSTLSSGFMCSTCLSTCQFSTAVVTQNHLLSIAGGAESMEATHDKGASTSASGIEGTTDVLKLKLLLEVARAQRESRAVNADEYSANQAKDTADDYNWGAAVAGLAQN